MSTEEGEAGPVCGEERKEEPQEGTTITHRHTWEEGGPRGSQGHPHPDDEDEAEEEEGRDACGGNEGNFNEENNEENFSSEDGAGDLLNPCRCDGSVRYTHQHCLLKWISERGCWTCELCCYRFHVIAINMKRPWQAGDCLKDRETTWSVATRQGLIVHEGAAVYNVFMRWRAVNLHWDVQSYNKAKDMEETSTGHSSLGPRTLWLPLATFGPNGPLNSTQLGPQPWTCLCLAPFCPSLVPRNNLSQDSDSGEVVIRVTSV
eukprot:superscaffoldBa00001136_g9131